jgi:hypothetical protein
MTRMNPLRRLAATAAIVGVTGFGAVALAGPALADTTAPADTPSASVETSSTVSVTMPELVAGLFSKENSVGSVDLARIATMTPMTMHDLTGAIHSTATMSPLPAGAVQVKVGPLKLTLVAPVAQKVQTILANFYSAQGFQVTYNLKGVLTIGKRICDDTKSKDWNKGCVNPATDPRF